MVALRPLAIAALVVTGGLGLVPAQASGPAQGALVPARPGGARNAVGTTAAVPDRAANVHPLYPLPAAAVLPEPCPPPPIPPLPPPAPLGAPIVAERAVPVVKAAAARRVSLSPIRGKGVWLTLWPGSPLDVRAVVAAASKAGLHQLWVRTGSSKNGFYGGGYLRKLVPAAHADGISVIAWDFPTLSDPAADALRAALAFKLGADAFSPDIETAAEGTFLTARRVRYYLSLVRAAAGDRAVIATVMWPTRYWLAHYPYGAEAPFVNAFAPMVYWSCMEPGAAVDEAVVALSRMRPVAPIGQDFNMGPIGGRPGLPSPKEIWRFLDAARRAGAVGASLYDLEAGARPQFRALAGYPWPPAAP